MSTVVITFDARPESREAIAATLGGVAEVRYLGELSEGERASALKSADALICLNPASDLAEGELDLIANAKLVQLIAAGVDFIPFERLPPGLPVASNAGSWAEPIAEHVVAMALAAAKRLAPRQAALARGDFNQTGLNLTLRDRVLGVLGYGGIGRATARLMRGLGMRVHAVNRSGRTDDPVEFVGAGDALGQVLAAADVLLVATPLTAATVGLIGAAELALMKETAIVVNVARGEIIDEAALYAHLKAHPDFTACIDAWWVEPIRHGEFRMDHPFLDLPNVIGSPHNSFAIPGAVAGAIGQAAANVKRVLAGEPPDNLVRAVDMPAGRRLNRR